MVKKLLELFMKKNCRSWYQNAKLISKFDTSKLEAKSNLASLKDKIDKI